MRMSQPGPGGQANVAPWRRWLLPASVTAGLVALLRCRAAQRRVWH